MAISKLNGPLIPGGGLQTFALSPDGRFAAYTARQDSLTEVELYVARTDGSGWVKASGPMVAGGGVLGGVPIWAPDSSRVAYWANQDTLTATELYTVRPDGTGMAKINGALVAGGNVNYFGQDPWAPDSSRLAYTADQDTDNVVEAYTSLPDGTGNVKISGAIAAPGGLFFGQPLLWSPDSSRIAYLAAQDIATTTELYAASPSGGGTQKLNGVLVAGGNVFQALWAPDSSRIVYLADQDTDTVNELYSSLANGSGNTRLNDPALPVGSGVFSFLIAPDSSRVAYLANPSGPVAQELFAAPIAGGSNVTLNGPLVLNGGVSAYRWAPDSSRVAYVADQDTDGVNELYTSLPNGAGNVKISGPLPALTRTDMSTSPTVPGDWAPDASLVSYVVFSIGAPAPFQIPGFSALPDGGGSVEYTGVMDPTTTGLGNWPVWSPDSSRLMYVAHQDSGTMWELYMTSPDGTSNQNISGPLVATGNVDTTYFQWSP
jgi:Tol biopolymer transport system component